MNYTRTFFLFVVMQIVCVFAINSKKNIRIKRSANRNWSDWIIVPGHSKGRHSGDYNHFEPLRRMDYYPLNRSYTVNSYLKPTVEMDQHQIEPYVLAISKRNENSKEESTSRSNDPSEITVSVRGVAEKIKSFFDSARDFFSGDIENDSGNDNREEIGEGSYAATSRKKNNLKKFKKKYKKILLPLLLAYKLKFFTLVPVLIGGLILLVGTTGMAGFFFALFAAIMSLKPEGHGQVVFKRY